MLAVTSAARTTSLVALERVPASWRPYLAYLLGLLGILLAGYTDRLWPPRRAAPLAEPPAAPPAADEAPVLRRRRRSSSMISPEMSGGGGGSSKTHRRTSLPCIPREQQILWIKSFQSGMCEDLIEKCGLRNSLILLPAERCLPVISSMPAEDAQLLQSSLTQI
ncbi:cGMP-inhibited 3',5'-cyclic phosphodiesterase 3A-like [Rissa tridactyla]|uniref:cGMP-inhibited 3',5'-cyclic phosphodiesterase 3A-like n=1 Tax=Rissa tridactyla TaxID=75485 RepID=UPI0023BA6243|nr:cGMP-inhibited 3',5'-cyclic phosphodiesterase 3A-like [Rissa tridactyla]